MRRVCQRTIGLVLAAMIAALVGCETKDSKQPRPGGKKPAATTGTTTPGDKSPGDKASGGGKVSTTKDPKATEKTSLNEALAKVEEKTPAEVPEVKLTEGMRASCLVGVGDAMPQADLQDLDGKTTPLSTLLGKKATLVFFWDDGETPTARMLAITALEDLQRDVFAPSAESGLAVVAVNVGDKSEDIRKALDEAGAKFPTLADEKGEYFAKLAKDSTVPRIYLLDPAGKIVWFDVEFSSATRRDLKQALPAVLKKK